jgi:hypothetical protein
MGSSVGTVTGWRALRTGRLPCPFHAASELPKQPVTQLPTVTSSRGGSADHTVFRRAAATARRPKTSCSVRYPPEGEASPRVVPSMKRTWCQGSRVPTVTPSASTFEASPTEAGDHSLAAHPEPKFLHRDERRSSERGEFRPEDLPSTPAMGHDTSGEPGAPTTSAAPHVPSSASGRSLQRETSRTALICTGA